jgi:hypothetical protein
MGCGTGLAVPAEVPAGTGVGSDETGLDARLAPQKRQNCANSSEMPLQRAQIRVRSPAALAPIAAGTTAAVVGGAATGWTRDGASSRTIAAGAIGTLAGRGTAFSSGATSCAVVVTGGPFEASSPFPHVTQYRTPGLFVPEQRLQMFASTAGADGAAMEETIGDPA